MSRCIRPLSIFKHKLTPENPEPAGTAPVAQEFSLQLIGILSEFSLRTVTLIICVSSLRILKPALHKVTLYRSDKAGPYPS